MESTVFTPPQSGKGSTQRTQTPKPQAPLSLAERLILMADFREQRMAREAVEVDGVRYELTVRAHDEYSAPEADDRQLKAALARHSGLAAWLKTHKPPKCTLIGLFNPKAASGPTWYTASYRVNDAYYLRGRVIRLTFTLNDPTAATAA